MSRLVIDVDDRGRASLAKMGYKNIQLVAEKIGDQTYTLQPAVILTASEAEQLSAARRSQKEGRVKPGRLRTR